MEVEVIDHSVEMLGKGILESLQMSKVMNKVVFVSFPKISKFGNFVFRKGRFIVSLLPVQKPVIRLDIFKSLWVFLNSVVNYFKIVLFLSKLIDKERVNLIKVENIALLGFPVFLVSKFKGVPYVLWVAGPELKVLGMKLSYFKPLYLIVSFAYKVLARFVIRNAVAVINISPESTDLVLSMNPRVYKFLNANYVDTTLFRPKECTLKKEKYVLLYVGRLEQEKGIELLIDSVKKLSKMRSDFELWIIGYGTMYEQLKKLSEQGLPIKLLGKKDIRGLPRYYNCADVFIFPSLVEGPSAALLEAMACGVPVVSTTGPIKNYENGILVDRDSDSIVKAIVTLLDNKALRNKLSRNAARFVRGMVEKYLKELYLVYILAYKKAT